MEPTAIILLLIALGLGFLAFRLAHGMDWHWSVGLTLALIPIALTFFMGIFGLLGSAVFVGGLYKAAAG